ncbi:MAG: phosphatase PAP2 family protein, partial [Muribaculaceae bacterium]|nr:phosphatase PAP2 family protein [Muribaculaceae bacterium]
MKRLITITLLSLCAGGAQAQTFDTDSAAKKTVAARQVPEIIASAGGSVVINAAVTEILKHSVHEMRPDRSANNSFPSRHTSWAFAASTVLSNELFAYSPWYSLSAQAVSSAVGYQRVLARRHYASDVLAGAVTGVLSTELAYLISRSIFGTESPWHRYSSENVFRPSLAISTAAIFNFSHSWSTGYSIAADFRLPVDRIWGVTAAINSTVTPVKTGVTETDAVYTIGFLVGAVWHHTLP